MTNQKLQFSLAASLFLSCCLSISLLARVFVSNDRQGCSDCHSYGHRTLTRRRRTGLPPGGSGGVLAILAGVYDRSRHGHKGIGWVRLGPQQRASAGVFLRLGFRYMISGGSFG